jgi:hypothetical protein
MPRRVIALCLTLAGCDAAANAPATSGIAMIVTDSAGAHLVMFGDSK